MSTGSGRHALPACLPPTCQLAAWEKRSRGARRRSFGAGSRLPRPRRCTPGQIKRNGVQSSYRRDSRSAGPGPSCWVGCPAAGLERGGGRRRRAGSGREACQHLEQRRPFSASSSSSRAGPNRRKGLTITACMGGTAQRRQRPGHKYSGHEAPWRAHGSRACCMRPPALTPLGSFEARPPKHTVESLPSGPFTPHQQ